MFHLHRIVSNVSQFRFDFDGFTFITTHISHFPGFFKSDEIDDENVVCILFALTLEGQVKKSCQTLSSTSIHSFNKFLKELHQSFDMYDYQDVCNRIDPLRMKYGESLDYFLNQFSHLCCEFIEGVIDSDFINEKFHILVLLSVKSFVSEILDDSTLPPYVDHETPQICEEPNIVPFPSPFLVLIWVPAGDDVKVDKSENQIVDPPISHDSDPIDENLEWFIN